jgi:predicted RNA-binding protein
MAIDPKAATPPADRTEARWRDLREVQALRDIIRMYRKGIAALATDVTELRGEVHRLRDALRADRVLAGTQLVEVEIDLDEHAQDLVATILLAEWGDLPTAVMEDVMLVARELTAGSLRRNAASAHTHATLRGERSPRSLRVEVQALEGAGETLDATSEDLSIVERLSERWGTEHVKSGRTTVWAQLSLSRD